MISMLFKNIDHGKGVELTGTSDLQSTAYPVNVVLLGNSAFVEVLVKVRI